MCPRERFTSYKSLSRLVLFYKRIGPPCCTLFTFVTRCSLQIILSQYYLLPLSSVLAENTLLETAYHFLPLLIGFDTLTYWKDYDRSPILVGHHRPTGPQLVARWIPLSLSRFSIQWSLWDLFDVTLFVVCLLGSDELWFYDQIYVFIHESYLSLLISYAWLLIASCFFFEYLV